jgi:hypothetical protein
MDAVGMLSVEDALRETEACQRRMETILAAVHQNRPAEMERHDLMYWAAANRSGGLITAFKMLIEAGLLVAAYPPHSTGQYVADSRRTDNS